MKSSLHHYNSFFKCNHFNEAVIR